MDALNFPPVTGCWSKAALAASGGNTTWSTTGATIYANKGKQYSTAAAASAASPTSDAVLGTTFAARPLSPNTGTVFVWAYNGGGTAATAVRVAQGTVEALDAQGNFVNLPQFPVGLDDGLTPFAYSIVRAGSTASNWVFGTSNWNATGITVVHQDVCTLPGRPQAA